MYQHLKSYWKKTIRLKSLVDSLKRYLVICLKEKILITICAHSLILFSRHSRRFVQNNAERDWCKHIEIYTRVF